jgi:1,4-dihydroxy-2-naphthoate polyprenyltransferase
MILEPQIATFPNPLAKYVAATRPAFLSVTLIGSLIGLATAYSSGYPLDALKAVLTVFFALVAHAGVNVINDYYDALNGSDAANTERQFPFTGGSRFIQNGILSRRQTGFFGYALLASVVPPGLWLAVNSAPELLLIGLAGLFVGWAYSAPPFKLMSRGVGELAIVAGWLLVCVGTDFVQRGGFVALPLFAGLPFALHVANILYINQFPDRKADASAGKRTVVVRLGAATAKWGYPLLALLAHFWLVATVMLGHLPVLALIATLTLPLSLLASLSLLRDASRPDRLVPAIKQTILAANLHGLLLVAALLATASGKYA